MDSKIYKAKRVDTQEWVVGYYAYDNHDIILENLNMRVRGTPELTNAHIVSKETVSRCTGYNDKNGNAIFENQIIKWFAVTYIVRYGYFAGQVGLGYYYGLGFYLERVCDATHRVPFQAVFVNEYEVIGNIFDDKELLKVEE